MSRTLHDSLNLVQGNSCQGGKITTVRGCEKEVERQRGAHTNLQMLLTLFSMEEPLSMFILIRGDSCGHLQPAYACVSPRLSEPAPFIILQQPCSNWAASPPAVTHRLLHVAPEEIQMYLVRHSPVAAHLSLHSDLICGQLNPAASPRRLEVRLFASRPLHTCLRFSPSAVQKPGNDVAYHLKWRQGNNPSGLEPTSGVTLTYSLARTLNISPSLGGMYFKVWQEQVS